MTTCSISLVLLVAYDMDAVCQLACAQHITRLASWLLQHHQLTLQISVHPPKPGTVIPSAGILQLLQDHLHHFDLYSLPTAQAAVSQSISDPYSLRVGASEFGAISHSQASVFTCYIDGDIDMEDPDYVVYPIHYTIAAMGRMKCLTKLHITFSPIADFNVKANFQLLAQLSCLTDLALQCLDTETSCEGVLQSSKQTLCQVTLTALSWAAATYFSLQDMPGLDKLTISVLDMTGAQAEALQGVRACTFDLRLYGSAQGSALVALSACPPNIHDLTIWPLPYSVMPLLCLPELPSLQRLTINCYASSLAHNYSHFLVSQN